MCVLYNLRSHRQQMRRESSFRWQDEFQFLHFASSIFGVCSSTQFMLIRSTKYLTVLDNDIMCEPLIHSREAKENKQSLNWLTCWKSEQVTFAVNALTLSVAVNRKVTRRATLNVNQTCLRLLAQLIELLSVIIWQSRSIANNKTR